ncbi:nickel/cobalt transporter [Bradyrhizobium sp. LHD-71]|nr:nickel/cobalt transporter [Bradyrhizobium sp. LHD-71]MDQ8728968.1 nickel/cobalt transporter [Bradyrhizobium sp. LHD-71]
MRVQHFALLALACATFVAADGALHLLAAQVTPFGGRSTPPPQEAGGVIGWILAKQAEFYRAMSSTIRAAKTDGTALWTLMGISFAYGVFHAAGPGHGKAVISSYLVANEETARRGIALSFVSALMQSLVAVLVVGIGAWLLGATARSLCSAERIIEIVSYGLIAALGVWLVFTKGRSLLNALPFIAVPSPALASAGAPMHDHHHDHDHAHHHDSHDHDHGHAHAHAAHNPPHGHPDHVHDEHCGHNHGPSPAELAGPGGWMRGLSAIFAVGLRPCSGAILVLVFALAQGLFVAGIAATFVMGLGTALTVATIAVVAVSAKGLARRLTAGSSSGRSAIVLRGLEFAAACMVLFLGAGLLMGYLAAERTVCF